LTLRFTTRLLRTRGRLAALTLVLVPGLMRAQRAPVTLTVEIVPNHVCTCVNLQDVICAAREGVVEHVWTVEARGKVR